MSHEAGRWTRALHRDLDAAGRVAWLARYRGEVWATPATFSGRRRLVENARQAAAVWADIDPPAASPKVRLRPLDQYHRPAQVPRWFPWLGGRPDIAAAEDPRALVEWRASTLARVRSFEPAPSMVVDSGRGYHAYWILVAPVELDGGESADARLLVVCNLRAAELLAGDCAHDLARPLRVPGSLNPKNGQPCRLLFDDGPRYGLAGLAAALRVTGPSRPTVVRFPTPPPLPPTKRCRGRPRLGVTVLDLRRIRPMDRDLIVGGPWRAAAVQARRLTKRAGLDRSRYDWAAVTAMIVGGWDDGRIFAAFRRADWAIGEKYRDKAVSAGQRAADRYLARTIARARASHAERARINP